MIKAAPSLAAAVLALGVLSQPSAVEALAALINVVAEARSLPQWFLAGVKERAAGGWPSAQAARRAIVV